MPTLTQSISKFSVASRLTKHKPSASEQLLSWLQGHPEETKHVTFQQIAARNIIPGLTSKQVLNAFANLTARQYIICKPHNKGRGAPKNIYINYLHAGLPKSIKDNAPKNAMDEVIRLTGIQPLTPEPKNISKKTIPKPTKQEITVPVDKGILENGLSLALNINFNITKEQ